jgi:hypothetical protein
MTEPIRPSGAMESRGAYNRHARLQAGGAASALPALESVVAALPLFGEQALVIADYGASQGKNSLAPMRLAIAGLRARVGPTRPILVYHEDLPANDFNALFAVLDHDPDRYNLDDPNVFPCAIGRSFYGGVLPPDYVDLGWCSYAAMWLSRVPMLIPGHIHPYRAVGDVRATFERQGAKDWEAFLAFRSRELRAGGRLVVVLPAVSDQGVTGFETTFDHANNSLTALAREGVISAEERRRMVVGNWARSRGDLMAPFAKDGRFRALTVERCEFSALPDTAWAEYQQTGDSQSLAGKHAAFYRATFAPTLALALDEDAGRRLAFSARLEQEMRRRIADAPAPINSHVVTIVLAKAAP